MEINIRAQEVVDAQVAISKLGKIKMRGISGLTVARLQKKLGEEATTIFNSRNDILKRYGSQVALKDNEIVPLGKEKYMVPKDKRADFEGEVDELMNAKITITCDPLTPGLPDEVECEPEIWVDLLPFLEVNEE